MRQNIIEDVWADIFDVDQSTISRYITFLTPLVEKATEEDRPTEEDAAEATRDAIALVDGTLWPCWSWDGESKLWSGKYKTTGHGSLIVTNLQGRITFVSEPVTGNQHDMAKLKGSVVEKILKKAGGVFGDKGFIGTDYITTPIRKPECRELLQWEHEWNNQVSSFRAPVERAVATLKTWRILFTDYRRPLKTFKSFQYGNSVACCITCQEPGASSDLSTGVSLLGRPPALVLRPHPAGLFCLLVPLLGCGLLLGRDPLHGGGLFRGNGRTQVGVVLLPVAGLGFGVAGPDRLAVVILIASAICVPVW